MGDLVNGIRVLVIVEQDRERVAVEAGNGVTAADELAQSTRALHEQRVASRMAGRLVDELEAVEVDDEHGGRSFLATSRIEEVADPIPEQQPVGQIGQRVV